MKRKRILHLITGLEIGGAEMMLLKTLPKMQDDFDNRVCCIMGHGPMGKKLEEAGIPVYYLNLKNIFELGLILRFRKVTKELKPNILVTYLIHADLFGRVFGRLFGIKKIICNQRGSLLQWEFLRVIDRLTKCLVTHYIVQTKVTKRELAQKLHLPLEKFTVIPNSIDVSEYKFELDKDAKKKELGINPTNQNIVCVSNLRRSKGHEYLLEAFEEIYAKNNNINLLIVGDGEREVELREKTENYSSKNNIYFLGKRSDVKEILRISDVFILPTLAEGMSNAIMEAMATGLAIITTAIEVNKELIQDNYSGLLVPTQNSIAISQSIDKITYNLKLKNQLRFNAKEKIINNFSVKACVEKTKNLYNTIL
ncbi:MAG: glycosyltransferase [Parcubacteria group bacterium]|jgi:glycosyltransferase involved in cell wall biosynthesis